MIPKIPVTPISAANAIMYLSKMGGKDAPEEWQGDLDLPYKIGGVMADGYLNHKFILHCGNEIPRTQIENVIGIIRGAEEPDRYVLMGNHRDAWVYGAVDPSSGTAAMLEVTRAMGELVKSGKWRPRRTIMFCSWDAEEYGLIGSAEWLEEFEKNILFKAVTYINVDMAVQANVTLRAKATPHFRKLLYDVTKAVPNPDATEIAMGRSSVYDTWKAKNYDNNNKSRPYLMPLGSGSDFVFFMQKTGVTSTDLRYTWNEREQHISSYPVYHSVHDTLEYYEKFLDPDYNVTLAVAQVVAGLVERTSNEVIVPFSPYDYALEIQNMIGKIIEKYEVDLNKHGIELVNLKLAVDNLLHQTKKFMESTPKANKTRILEVRAINDKIMHFERAFLDFNGIPNRPHYRHIVYAPSETNSYQGAGFPGLVDSINNAKLNDDWDNVKKQLSITTFHLYSAASVIS